MNAFSVLRYVSHRICSRLCCAMFCWYFIYSAVSISGGIVSTENSQKTLHSSPVKAWYHTTLLRASYGASFVSPYSEQSFSLFVSRSCALFNIVFNLYSVAVYRVSSLAMRWSFDCPDLTGQCKITQQ